MKKLMSFKKLYSMVLVFALILGSLVLSPKTAKGADSTLLNTYGKTFGNMGTCINSWQLNDSAILNEVKNQYNSITLENEMKPDAMLGYAPTLLSVSEAKNLGYYIPSNYKESTVPKINFSTVDAVMKKCYDNGLRMRAHTLVWHSQTPAWFFRTGYSTNNGCVNAEAMYARMEMYIKTVMNHVYTSQYGSVVYAWDVVNEYLHASNSGWLTIYGGVTVYPEFVKRAFQYANDCIEYFGLQDSVSLFYNDFNTYMEVDDVITMINYINSNGKICDGVGMQSHVGTTFPSVDYYINALQSFVNAGFEVQITELDCANTSSTDLANYMYDLMTKVLKIKAAGGNITGITYWGISDQHSWVGENDPLLFSSPGNPKYAYYRVLDAYAESDFAKAPTVSQTATINDGWYHLKGSHSGKYLQVEDNKGGNGVNVNIGTGNGTDGQKWYVANVGDGYVTLKNGKGYMLDVQYGANEDGTNIQTYSANGATAQHFRFENIASGKYGLTTRVSSGKRALDVYDWNTADGTNVCQWTYYGANNQAWILEPASAPSTITDGWYYIKNVNAQKYLQVANNAAGNLVNVEIGTGSGVSGQKWYVTNTSDGYMTLKNGNGYMLDLNEGINKDGTNIQTWQANGLDPQRFKAVPTSSGAFGIVTKCSSDKKVLDVYNWGTSDGTNVCQWTYYGAENQLWVFEPCNN